jgi:hypothetical protein
MIYLFLHSQFTTVGLIALDTCLKKNLAGPSCRTRLSSLRSPLVHCDENLLPVKRSNYPMGV